MNDLTIEETFAEIGKHRQEIDRLMLSLMSRLAQTPDVRRVSYAKAAEIMDCSTKTVQRRVKAGKLRQEGRFILLDSMNPRVHTGLK